MLMGAYYRAVAEDRELWRLAGRALDNWVAQVCVLPLLYPDSARPLDRYGPMCFYLLVLCISGQWR